MREVSREEFKKRMLEYFKLVNQGYPEKMVETIREQWGRTFHDITDEGMVVFDREQFEQSLKELQKALEHEAKTEERIWYDYEKEVMPKIPNPLVSHHIPKSIRDRCGCKWISLKDIKKLFSGFQGTFYRKASLKTEKGQ